MKLDNYKVVIDLDYLERVVEKYNLSINEITDIIGMLKDGIYLKEIQKVI